MTAMRSRNNCLLIMKWMAAKLISSWIGGESRRAGMRWSGMLRDHRMIINKTLNNLKTLKIQKVANKIKTLMTPPCLHPSTLPLPLFPATTPKIYYSFANSANTRDTIFPSAPTPRNRIRVVFSVWGNISNTNVRRYFVMAVGISAMWGESVLTLLAGSPHYRIIGS